MGCDLFSKNLVLFAMLFGFVACGDHTVGTAEEDAITDLGCWRYADLDGDGYGNAVSASQFECGVLAINYVADASDCDDTDEFVHPGGTEISGDGIDQDCDGSDAAVESVDDVAPDAVAGAGAGDQGASGSIDDAAPAANPAVLTVETAYPLYFFLLIHTGEGDCAFENFDPTDVGEMGRYQNCRDGLRDVSARLGALGVKAVFQFHGGFLQKLLIEEIFANQFGDADPNFDFERDIIAYGHEIGFHHHDECLDKLDGAGSDDVCFTFGDDVWGSATTPDSDQSKKPVNDDQVLIRLVSVFSAAYDPDFTEFEYDHYFSTENPEIKSYCGWGAPYRIAVDMAEGSTEMADTIASSGIEILTSNNEFYVDWTESACFSGRESADGDNLKAIPHPAILPTASGKLVYYASPNPLFGDASFDLNANMTAFQSHEACAAARITGSSYQGEIFTWSGTTHLENMIQDVEGDGVPDGIGDVSDYLEALRAEVAMTGSFSGIEVMTLQEIEAVRAASEAVGANYSFTLSSEYAETPTPEILTGTTRPRLPVHDEVPVAVEIGLHTF